MATRTKKLILITGASGFVGNHTVAEFLKHGYLVRAAVRSSSSGSKLLKIHASKTSPSPLSYVIVPDITIAGAFDEAVKDVDGVIHMASPYVLNVEDTGRDLLVPAINGTRRILESVVKGAEKVRRVVITSSFAAVNDFFKGLREGWVYSEKDWNPITYEEAKENKMGLAYAGSKTLAEQTAWKSLSETTPKPNFTISTILPPMIYGPPFPNSLEISSLPSSPQDIYNLMNGSLTTVLVTRIPVFADVREVALAHVRAFENEEDGRFLVVNGKWSKRAVCRLFREKIPELKGRVPEIEEGSEPECYGVDTKRARKVLGLRFRGWEETFLDMAKAFLEMERAEKVRNGEV